MLGDNWRYRRSPKRSQSRPSGTQEQPKKRLTGPILLLGKRPRPAQRCSGGSSWSQMLPKGAEKVRIHLWSPHPLDHCPRVQVQRSNLSNLQGDLTLIKGLTCQSVQYQGQTFDPQFQSRKYHMLTWSPWGKTGSTKTTSSYRSKDSGVRRTSFRIKVKEFFT